MMMTIARNVCSMADAERASFVAKARARVEAKVDALAAIDVTNLTTDERARLLDAAQQCIELLAWLTDQAIEAQVAATAYAGRNLMPAEMRGLLLRH
jgi:hypothetical protein